MGKKNRDKIYDELFKKISFTGCAIRTKNIISFWGQEFNEENDDPFEIRPTGAFFYYQDEINDADKWAYRMICESTGINCSAAFLPKEQWVFVTEDGLVFVTGADYDDWEQNVTSDRVFFNNVKNIGKEYAYAISSIKPIVYRRDAANNWQKLDKGLPETTSNIPSGFLDIAGFNSSEVYACGRNGNLWIFNGEKWTKIKIPTTVNLNKLCCADDGLVYILTDDGRIIFGKENSWKIIEQNITEDRLQEIVWYTDRIYVSTEKSLYEVINDTFEKTKLKLPKHDTYTHLASGDGIFLIAGSNQVSMYDGKKWHKIV